MNEQIKQRLVGAVVLVSLAVIFIPMLLDGGDDSSMPRFGSNVPEQPEFGFEPLEIPLQPVDPIPERPRVIDKAEEPQTPETDSQQRKPAEVPKPAEPTKAVEPPSPKPAAKAIQPAAGKEPITWVVQVGSFSQSSNAMELRDKLRKNGFTAFVEKYRDKGKTSYRVRVGPELKRETAEKHLKQLESKLQIKGIIMGHP